MSVSVLSCSGIARKYDRVFALRNVTLTVAPGDILLLLGRNGAGKSTCLQVCAGAIRAHAGSIEVCSVDMRRGGDDARRRLGFVAHESFLYSDLTVMENIVFYARLYGVTNPQQRASELLERFHLAERARTLARALSRGLKQRVSIARALVHEPSLLLLDEPFTGLDEPACDVLTGVVREFATSGGGVVLTTHDLGRGEAMMTRFAILERGTVAHEQGAEPGGESIRDAYSRVLRAASA